MESATQDRPSTSPPAVPPLPEPVQPEPGWLRLFGERAQRFTAWMSQWSIEQRVLAGFGLVFLGIIAISIMSYRNTAVVVKNSRLDPSSHELVQLLGSIEEALIAAESGHRRYLVTGDESYLKAHRAIVEQMPEYMRYLQALAGPVAEQRARIAQLEELSKQQLDIEANAIRERAERGPEAVRRLAMPGVAKREFDDIHRLITDLESSEQQSAGARFVQWTG